MIKTEPFDLAVGESYQSGKIIRKIEEVSVKMNTVKFIENEFFRGYCSIDDFYYWLDKYNS